MNLNKIDKNVEHNENCIFCKIVKKEIPAKIIAENDKALAFLDISPASVGHSLIIPKKHFIDLSNTSADYLNAVINLAKFTANILEETKSLDVWGINYLSNQGSIAGQVVNHFHMHVIPKYAVNEGFKTVTENIYLDKDVDQVHELLLKTAKKHLKNKYQKAVDNVQKEETKK
ncbi:MAG: HIT family protein [Ureaplasma sp.]|nr:HIT family protein [Ureaplasma sp.]